MLPFLAVPFAFAAPRELHVWHAYRGGEREALEAIVRKWDEGQPDLDVVMLYTPYESFFTKLEAAAPRGNGPDLFIAAHERLGGWVRSGLVVPREGAVEDLGLHPVTVDAFTVDGKLWGVPLAFKCLALFTNPELVPDPPETTDELVAIARQLRSGDTYGLVYQATEPYYTIPWLTGFGGGIFLGDRVVLERPENAAALAFVHQLSEEGLVPEDPTGALVTQLFNAGRAGMVVNGPWFQAEIDPTVLYEIHPLPVVSATGRPASPFLTVDGAMVSAYAKEPEAAWALAQHLVAPGPTYERAGLGDQSVSAAWIEMTTELSDRPILDPFRAQLPSAIPMPNRPEMASTWEPLAKAVRRSVRGAMAPDKALTLAQREYEIVRRPPAPAKDPRPWMGLLAIAVVALVAGAGMWLRRESDRIRAFAFAYAYALPAIVAMVVLVLSPFVVGAAVSLFSHDEGRFTFVGLQNFVDILTSRDWPPWSPMSFYFTSAVTVLWTVTNVALHAGIGLALALLLREPWLKLRPIYRVLLIVPWAVPNYITALIWKAMFHRQFGAINGVLEALGLEPVSWFSQFSTAFTANLVTNTWLGFPFMMVVTLGALQSIPRDLEDAAAVDGASAWQRFRHVTFPLLLPALLPAVVLGSVWTFNMFNVVFLVSGGEPDGATEILISETYRWAFGARGYKYGYAAAYAVLIFAILFVYSKATERLLQRVT